LDAKILCLGVLMLGTASGYKIKKHFEDGPFAHFHAAGFGSIYPALSALLEAGYVTCTVTAQDGRPDKKVYAITDAGRRAFRAALNRPPTADTLRSETLFMLFFAELLDPDHRRELFDGYLAEHRERVARMTDGVSGSCEGVGQHFVHGLGLAIYRAIIDHLERHRDAVLALAPQDAARPQVSPAPPATALPAAAGNR